MADAQRNAAGFFCAAASTCDRFRVLTTRLSRMRRFLADVQRPATLSPDRWMTASKPETEFGGTACMGSHCRSWSARGAWRTSRVTSHPCDSRNDTMPEPIRPEAPLIRTRIAPHTVSRARALAPHLLCAAISCADIIKNKETGHRILLSGLVGQSLP